MKYLKFTILALFISGTFTAVHAMEHSALNAGLSLKPLQQAIPALTGASDKLNKPPPYKLNIASITAKHVLTSATLLKEENSLAPSKWPSLTTPDNKPYSFVLFKSAEITMPTVEAFYSNYGFNKAVSSSLNFFSEKRKESFKELLSRAGKYIGMMSGIFTEKGLPPELTYLPLIESGFRTDAYSPKKAAGPWQFIPETAKRFGLKIDWWVDERRDPVKSTAAAARYLGELYERFGDWNLALAAYNAGEGRIENALKKLNNSNFWRIRNTGYIAKETKNYVPSYIAATAIAIDPESFGFYDIDYDEPFKYDTVEINTPMDLAAIAEFTGVTTSAIKELNPELNHWYTPPNVSSYTVRIPYGTKEIFLASLSDASEDDLLYVELYKVKKGDTIAKIAKQLKIHSQAILNINPLKKLASVKAGETILIPRDREKGISDGLTAILKSKNF
ncbi:MAG: transglycosylase [Nitrospirae bacterium]|nr:transglycosylase [Nitrospirota bacterium]